MSGRRTISVPGVVYRRAKAYAKTIDLSLSGFVSRLVAEDLAAAGVSDDDPGMPGIDRVQPGDPTPGPRRSFSLQGLLYRRARSYAAALGVPLSGYAVILVEVELERVGFPEDDPGPQPRGRGGAPPGPRFPLVKTAGPSPSFPPQPQPPPRPSKKPRTIAEDEARCAEALAAAGMFSAGVFLL